MLLLKVFTARFANNSAKRAFYCHLFKEKPETLTKIKQKLQKIRIISIKIEDLQPLGNSILHQLKIFALWQQQQQRHQPTTKARFWTY